jgi:predicted metalloprotease with PDZ domain
VKIEYQVSFPQPASHLLEVQLKILNWSADRLALTFPVWTPGSYLVREYAKQLQDFSAETETGEALVWKKLSKHQWEIDTSGRGDCTPIIRYRIFANELSVRTNHLDLTHGYFNGAALFFFIPGYERNPIEVTVVPPDSQWQVTTALPPVEATKNTFLAADFDTLVDSPFEVGQHAVYSFESCDKPHDLAIWGKGNLDVKRAIADIDRIIQVQAKLFGGLPYDRYLFLLHLSASGFGGLEHKNSCSLNYPRLGFRQADRYNRFMQLVAHEFFHLWNVKRIRPKELETFDYERENYTQSLWFCEGTTSYYDVVLPFRAGIYNAKTCLTLLSQEITRFLNTPGRQVQPLSESSWDAWIKLYRRDFNSDNSQISYYLKGEIVTFLLELLIRHRSKNERSLDDVMRCMWQQFGKDEIGFTTTQLQQVFELIAQMNLDDFFARYLHGTEELPLADFLEPFGLELHAETVGKIPFLGLRLSGKNGKAMIDFVEAGSPAQQAGIDPEDELLAIDGWRVTSDRLNERLEDYKPGDSIVLSLFHQDELLTVPVTLTEPRPSSYRIVPVKQPTIEQSKNFEGWLGVALSSV